jgi:ribonuclease HII
MAGRRSNPVRFVCGIDEAGRGPVIGPMVIAGIVFDEGSLPRLIDLEVKDSKLCTRSKREKLFDTILCLALRHQIAVILPDEIDRALLDPEMNLNLLEVHHQSSIIDTLFPTHVILDCPSPNIEAYTKSLCSRIKTCGITIQAEHKADVNYPIVSAASIIAKVTRDREIERLKELIGVDFGSGYPSDPKTRRFLADHPKEFGDIKRKTWKTFDSLA